MPCYDPRDSETDNERAASRRVDEANDFIEEMERKEIKTEVEVCKIMSATIKFLEEKGLLDEFTKFEKEWKPKKGLLKYHISHRQEDKDFYIDELNKMSTNKYKYSKKKRKGMIAEIKKAKGYKVKRGSKGLTQREIFSSKYLKAAR